MDGSHVGIVNMKILATTILVFLLSTMFFSLFQMSMVTDMSAGMTDCPFMAHEEVICPMNLAEHIGAWKSVFVSVTPTLTLLLAVTGVAVLVASVAPNLLQGIRYSPPPLYSWLRERSYNFSYRPLQDLFASGILHPKLY
jgi:hypothetical protein